MESFSIGSAFQNLLNMHPVILFLGKAWRLPTIPFVDAEGNAIVCNHYFKWCLWFQSVYRTSWIRMKMKWDDFSSQSWSFLICWFWLAQKAMLCSGVSECYPLWHDIVERGTANSGWWSYTWLALQIITSVVQTISQCMEFGMGMQACSEAPRFHHQWLPWFWSASNQTLWFHVDPKPESEGLFLILEN